MRPLGVTPQASPQSWLDWTPRPGEEGRLEAGGGEVGGLLSLDDLICQQQMSTAGGRVRQPSRPGPQDALSPLSASALC